MASGLRLGVRRFEVDDVAKVDLALVERVPPDCEGREGERAVAEPREHDVAAGLDAFGNGDLTRARKQFHRAHIAEIHAHGVVRALDGILRLGLDRN